MHGKNTKSETTTEKLTIVDCKAKFKVRKKKTKQHAIAQYLDSLDVRNVTLV